jgi:diguanylate cyclase (GGDEF)-like protein
MQNYSNMVKLNTLTDGDQVYVVNRDLGIIIILIALALIILTILLFTNIKRRKKIEKIEQQEKQALKENYIELEAAYEESSSSKNELITKYEEIKRSKEKVKKLAYTDYLTELPNRLAFTEMLDSVMLTLRNEEVIALMEVDIDNFKTINDTLGHSYGDELLIDVTHRLKQVIDENDYIARTGGDEFIILSQNIEDIGNYEDKIKKIQKVFGYPFVLAMTEYFVTVSIGVVMAPKDGKTTQVLLKNVDSAMCAAKDTGKNTFYYFNDSINEKLMEKIQTQSELRKAIENQEFEVYYQAQMDLTMNRITGFEALVRWNHPTKGILTPKEFMPLAEETGLVVLIGGWALREACQQLKQWEQQGYDKLTMSVNISNRQFKDKDLLSLIQEVLHETGINPKQLILEITESLVLEDLDNSIAIIRKLKEYAIEFSLDKFGTGVSSLNYLKVLPVSSLKIDKSSISNLQVDTREQNIVKAFVFLAQSMDLLVIAEGVETKEQETFLKNINCNKAQGYLYSMPVSNEEAELLLSKTNILN